MSDPQIRYAIDPDTGNTVDAQAGFLPKKPYKCIRCGGVLDVYQGAHQIWHFRHRGHRGRFGGENAEDCPLYYGGHYEDLLKDLRTSEIEAAEREKLIRVVVIPPPYGRTLRVCGVLPTIDREELPDGIKVSSLLSSMELVSVGVRTPPVSDLFHPRNAEVLVELDPSAESYEIQIDSQFNYPALTGRWTCDSLREGDVFAGEDERAERIAKVSSINKEETVYVFLPSLPDWATSCYRAGPWYVVPFDLDESTAILLEELSGEKWQNPHSFYADVVLPPDADPRSCSPIIGEPSSAAVIAVIPPPDMDPEFEVVSVPLQKGWLSELPKAGEGKPRWYRIEFPYSGSRRLSIHWAARHRVLHLHTRSSTSSPAVLQDSLAAENPLGLESEQEGSTSFVESWSSTPIQCKVRDDTRCLSDLGVLAFVPPGFRFDVVAQFEKSSDVGPSVRRREIEFEDLDQEFRSWVQEGLEEVVMDFDALGSLQLVLEPADRWKKDLTDTKIKECIRKMEELPKKARWSLVRQVCELPPGTPHVEFPTGIKKRVRKALREVQNERQK
jgi:hypothetical protein